MTINIDTQRLLLFFFGCMTTRFGLAYVAFRFPQYLSLMGWLSLIPAIGFTVIYLFKLRPTGPEVFGQKIWWNDLRPLHAALYFAFAYLAIFNYSNHAWKVLLLDAIVGLVAFVVHRF